MAAESGKKVLLQYLESRKPILIEPHETKDAVFNRIQTLFNIDGFIIQKYDSKWEEWLDIEFADIEDKDKIKVVADQTTTAPVLLPSGNVTTIDTTTNQACGSQQLTISCSGNGHISLGPPNATVESNIPVKQHIPVDVQKIREESAIYNNVVPGSFLYDYRSRLNSAAFELALEDPTLISNKGTLVEHAKRKLDESGFIYKKKRSRSTVMGSPQPEKPTLKLKKEIRAKKIQEIGEDLEESRKEIFHLERSREKARNVNADERALRLSKEMEPLRAKKRRLEEELQLLQQKEAKSSKDKERRSKKTSRGSIKHSKESKSSFGSLDALVKHLEGSEKKSQTCNATNTGEVQAGTGHQSNGNGSGESANQSSRQGVEDEDCGDQSKESVNDVESSVSASESASLQQLSPASKSFLVQKPDSQVTVQN